MMGVTGTTFDELRRVNVKRCEAVFHPLARWSLLEWAGAMCGEAGEAANVAKKIRRLDDADAADDDPKKRVALLRDFLVELADVVTYADLAAAIAQRLAAELGVEIGTLGDAVRDKFNKVSVKRGAAQRL